jgi:DNA recombination protein RmuC
MEYTLIIIVTLSFAANIFLIVKVMSDKNDLRQQVDYLKDSFTGKFDQVNDRIDTKLTENSKMTQQTFMNVTERLVRIDEAQKSINTLGQNVSSLQDILTDKKTRGIFGEIQLTQVLVSVFGEVQGSTYELQKMLSNQKIVDALLLLPEPLGRLAIDSKFPLENYKKMTDQTLEVSQRKVSKGVFVKNVKKHIDDIKNKYIIKGETAEQAVMFVPAEAIFAEIHAYHPDIIDYAIKHSVWITSPTTLIATLTTIQTIVRNIEQNKHMSIIHDEINKLGKDFSRYKLRWEALSKHMATVNKDLLEVNTSSEKIEGRFQKIINLDLEGRA